MKVSFLVTYYNQAQYVSKSLDSLLAIKKNFDWEILVGDDGSSDETVKKVNEYISRYPEKIRLYQMPREKDKLYNSILRASANRLNLVEHSTGDCFCILDGDDWYCNKDFIKKAIDVYTKNLTVSVIAFNFQMVYKDTIVKENILKLKDSTIIPAKIYLKKSYTHSGACVFFKAEEVRKNIDTLKRIGYFDDNDIVINNLNYGDLFYIADTIYSYRQTGESIWTGINLLEQHLINLIAMDADILISPDLKNGIINRAASAIIYCYIFRKTMTKYFDENKMNKYKEMSLAFENGISKKIIFFDTISKIETRELKNLILRLSFSNPKLLLSALKSKCFKKEN